MAKPNLSVVAEDSPPPPKLSVKQAAQRSHRDLLVSLRDKIASEIDAGVPAHALAPNVKKLLEINLDIQAIDAKLAQEANEGAVSADEEWDASAL